MRAMFDDAIKALEREEQEREEQLEHEERRAREAKRAEVGTWAIRALGTFIACQHYGIQADKFPLSYTGFIFANLAGNSDDTIKACKQFVESMQKPLALNYELQNKEKNQ